MSAVNYSKWDKMLRDMSDSEDEELGTQPKVTTFDEPQSVTFGGKAVPQGESSEDRNSKDYSKQSKDSKGQLHPAAGEGRSIVAAGIVQAHVTDEALVENGAAVFDDNGQLRYVWRQNRGEVTAVFPIPSGTRAGDIDISISPKPETLTDGVADLLRLALKNELIFVNGELAHQSKLEEDIEWELKDFPGTIVAADRSKAVADGKDEPPASSECQGTKNSTTSKNVELGERRGLEVTLRKHCPIPGAAIWWKSFLKGDPEIDVSSLKGRTGVGHQSAWEEAMGMFKANVAERKRAGKITIDSGDTG